MHTEHAIRIRIKNASVLSERTVTLVHGNQGGTGSGYPPYMERDSAWLNYHWRIFRAEGESATLTVSDWISDSEPGAPPGQDITYNFINVQSYYSKHSKWLWQHI